MSLSRVDLHRLQEMVAQNLARMNKCKPLARGYIRKVNAARIQILALDGHGVIPCERSDHLARRSRT